MGIILKHSFRRYKNVVGAGGGGGAEAACLIYVHTVCLVLKFYSYFDANLEERTFHSFPSKHITPTTVLSWGNNRKEGKKRN